MGHQASPQEVFFGTEYRNPDVAQFVVPIELVAAVFFILIALMFVGLGQVLGRAFDAYPNRVLGYSLNIGGSLAGILAFLASPSPDAAGGLVPVRLSPVSAICFISAGALSPAARSGAGDFCCSFSLCHRLAYPNHETRWSPYYLFHERRPAIIVNNIGHQKMVPFETCGSAYSLIHLLEQHSGGAPFHDVLIIGAGSGNDIAHALRYGVDRIDAVEIDPVIQDIGIRYHPDQPYQDQRVSRHLDDGRHFLRTTDRKYDLVVYALVDSLILHSGYANIRLESYLFTEQAFADIDACSSPTAFSLPTIISVRAGSLNALRPWPSRSFGCDPIVLGLPYVENEIFRSARSVVDHRGCNPTDCCGVRERDRFG